MTKLSDPSLKPKQIEIDNTSTGYNYFCIKIKIDESDIFKISLQRTCNGHNCDRSQTVTTCVCFVKTSKGYCARIEIINKLKPVEDKLNDPIIIQSWKFTQILLPKEFHNLLYTEIEPMKDKVIEFITKNIKGDYQLMGWYKAREDEDEELLEDINKINVSNILKLN